MRIPLQEPDIFVLPMRNVAGTVALYSSTTGLQRCVRTFCLLKSLAMANDLNTAPQHSNCDDA
jgi:hypothetical protein